MIIDAHLHVWRAKPDYPDLKSNVLNPLADVPVELLAEYMTEHGVARAVLVQPVYYGEDNSYVTNSAVAAPDRYAAVCVVDPRKPGAVERLAYWKQQGCTGLRLRPRFADESAIFGDPATFPLWEQARALGLVVSILCNMEHLETIGALAARFPDVDIVIDHMAFPDVKAGTRALPFQHLLDLARFPRVYVKLSGFYYTSRQPYPWPDCWDFVRAVYDRYGSKRLIWGSDFPHLILKTDYRRNLLFLQRAFSYMNGDDLDRIMGGNALRLYWR